MDSVFKVLWSPWRSEYIKSFGKSKKEECLFCILPKKNDEEAYIVYRGKYAYVVLNAFPYNSGHLMIVPYRHVRSVIDLRESEIHEIFDELLKKSILALSETLRPDGFNVGINIGRVAGAGIEDHVHVHVVPRWIGDTNFMPVISGTKSLPVALDETYRILRDYWVKNFGR